MKTCACKDFKENWDKVNAPFVFMQVTRGYILDFKVFEHCPWCGSKLVSQELQVAARQVAEAGEDGEG